MDRDLLGFALPDGQALPHIAAAHPGREEPTVQAILFGQPAHEAKKGQEVVMTDQNRWTKWATLALLLDVITIGCIVWLLFH